MGKVDFRRMSPVFMYENEKNLFGIYYFMGILAVKADTNHCFHRLILLIHLRKAANP